MSIRIFIFLLFVLSIKVLGQENTRWEYFFITIEKSKGDDVRVFYYFDTETLRRNTNNTVNLWVKGEPEVSYYDSEYSKYVDKLMINLLIDCVERQYGGFSYIYYFSDGTMKSNSQEFATMRDIFPETMAEELFFRLCK